VLPIPGSGFRTTYRIDIVDEDGNRCRFIVERLVGKLLEDRRIKIVQLERENAELRKQLEQAEARCRLLQAVADEAHSKLREYVRMQGVMVDGRVPPSWRKLADALAATATAPKSSKPE